MYGDMIETLLDLKTQVGVVEMEQDIWSVGPELLNYKQPFTAEHTDDPDLEVSSEMLAAALTQNSMTSFFFTATRTVAGKGRIGTNVAQLKSLWMNMTRVKEQLV